jgi:uncharacterized protein YbjQ (UPF0145 family)
VPAQRFDQVLPPAAVARLNGINRSGTWASALSTDEFAAIKSVGFEPVGQVLGAVVYKIGYESSKECPTYCERKVYQLPVYTMVSSTGVMAAYAPLVNSLYEARRRAIARMSAECAALGGHGVVGVSLEIGSFPAAGIPRGSSPQANRAVEFRAIGTAVRAPGAVRLKRPFTSDVSGQEFAKLIMAGMVPVSLVLGISIGVRHDDWLKRGQSRWALGNVEVGGYTELVNRTRADARNELKLDVSRVHAEGVVVKRMDLRTSVERCEAVTGGHDQRAEVTIVGTAITAFTQDRRAPQGPSLAVLSLDPERRAAARPARSRPDHRPTIQVLEPGRQDNEQGAFDSSEERQ